MLIGILGQVWYLIVSIPDLCILTYLYLFGFKTLNFNIFGGFHKNEYFCGMKILWIFFWGHHKNGLYLGVIFYAF